MKSGGVLVTVSADDDATRERAQEILYANGGHNAGRARAL